jgi:hypothetical protein
MLETVSRIPTMEMEMMRVNIILPYISAQKTMEILNNLPFLIVILALRNDKYKLFSFMTQKWLCTVLLEKRRHVACH